MLWKIFSKHYIYRTDILAKPTFKGKLLVSVRKIKAEYGPAIDVTADIAQCGDRK